MEYFKLKNGAVSDLLYFQEIQLTCNDLYLNELCEAFEITPNEYIGKANNLFNKYSIRVPQNYLNNCLKEYRLLGIESIFPSRAFMKCIACCIFIEEKFNLNTSKIIRRELINPNKRSDIYHACSMSMIALNYLNEGSEVIIPKEKKNQKNPDLIIDDFDCEIKNYR